MREADMYVGDRARDYIKRRNEMLSSYDPEWVKRYARKIHGVNYYDEFEAYGENMDLRYRGELGQVLDFAMIDGSMSEFAPFTQAQFQDYLEKEYIPEAKAVYGRTVEWFATALRTHAPYIYEEIVQAGGFPEGAEYIGADEQFRKFEVRDAEGQGVCIVYYDPSAQVFDVVWMGV